MITVRAIGAAEVQIGRKRITKSTELVLAVAVYLCVRAGDRLTRDEMIDVFWPGHDVAKGRHSLRQMLYKLRLKGFTLDEDGELLLVDRARVECDATRALEETWPETAEPWMIEDSGEFLPGVTRDISPQFQEWLDATRSRLGAQYRRAALRQIVQARREGRWADLERWGRVVLRTDPLNEEATLARAESSAMAGSKATALEILDQYVEDLGERAGQIALPATVLRRRISERKPEWGGRGVTEVALVGREGLMKQLTESIEAAAIGYGSAVVLKGAAGIGKTRLCHEARVFADLTGFKSVLLRIPSAAARQPLSVALTLTPLLLQVRGASGCPPLAMTLLRSTTNPQRVDRTDAPATTSPDDLTWALGALLEALTEECKLLIQLDDLHHCDAESLALLSRLAATTGSLRLLWLATSRLGHSAAGTALRHTSGFITLNVPALTLESSLLLADAYSRTQSLSRSQFELDRLAALSGGNPLFLRELSSRRDSRVTSGGTPASLRKLIRERLTELTSHELLVLRVIGLLGSHASIARVRALTRSENSSLADELDQLCHSGIVTLGPSGVIEVHESWQAVILEHITPVSSAALGLECGELLASEGGAVHSLSQCRHAAELYRDSGELFRASQLFEGVGDELRQRRLLAESADAYEQSVAALGEDEPPAKLIAKLAEVRHAARDFDSTIAVCNRALRGRSRLERADDSTRTYLEALEVDSLWKSGKEYRTRLEHLARAVGRAGIATETCHLASLIGLRLLMNDGHSLLESKFHEAVTASTASNGPSLYGQLALLVFEAERGTSDGVWALERSFSMTSLEDLPPGLQCLSLRYRSNALRWIGALEGALAHGHNAFARATEYGLMGEIDLIATQLTFTSMDNCDLASAASWLDRSGEATNGVTTHERIRARMHAVGRLRFQEGDYEGALQIYLSNGFNPAADVLGKRGAVVSATVAATAAITGRADLASSMVAHCSTAIGREAPSLVFDYVTEMTTRALKSLNRDLEATTLAANYLASRAKMFDRPIAQFYRELTLGLDARKQSSNA